MAYLKLEGEVGVDITMYNVVAAVQELRNVAPITELNIDVTSEGGDSETGRDLYKYFKSLEFPVYMNAVGYVCSAAFTLFLAGTKRTAQSDDVEFLMHSPKFAPNFFDAMFGLSDSELEYLRDAVNAEKAEMAKIYSEVLGIDKDTVITLMDKDEVITSATAKSLGIIHEIKETATETTKPFDYKIAAKWYANKQEKEILTKSKKMEIEKVEEKLSGLEKLTAKLQDGINKLLGNSIKALTINSDEGETLEITGDVLEVGAAVTSHEAGTFTVEYDGKKWTVVVAGSVVESLTEIVEPDANDEMEALKQQNADLQKQIEELTAKRLEAEKVEAKVAAFEAKFKALEAIHSEYKKEDGTYDFTSKLQKPEPESIGAKASRELKEKYEKELSK